MAELTSHFGQFGYSKLEQRIPDDLVNELEFLFPESGPGQRLLGLDPRLVASPIIGHLIGLGRDLLGEKVVAIRAIFFVKSQENNWLVPWHQDVTMAVPARFEKDGYRNWTMKDGIWHVQPPNSVLGKMVALRLHLDACQEEDGPLKVIPETHLDGRLSAAQIDHRVAVQESIALLADRGEVLAMAPLLLHSSNKATGVSRRRVLHLECCAASACPIEVFT